MTGFIRDYTDTYYDSVSKCRSYIPKVSPSFNHFIYSRVLVLFYFLLSVLFFIDIVKRKHFASCNGQSCSPHVSLTKKSEHVFICLYDVK